MTWIPGETNPTEEVIDYNALYEKELTGEISEDTARKTLGRFLMYNIGMLVELLTGKVLEPYQRIVVKGWLQKNFSLTVAGRSWGKSTVASHFAYLYCLFNPDHHILVCAATFRSSRQIVERINTWANAKTGRGILLKQTFDGEMTKRQDLIRITFKNGSTITAVPLGDPDNLRGFRCNVLLIDEGLLIPKHTIDMVLKPFLAGGSDATKKQKIRRKERKRIEEGKMTASEQMIFKAESKMIIISSASYRWEELYEIYKQYRAIIEKTDEKVKAEQNEKGTSSYLVHQMSYEVIDPNSGLLDQTMLDEIKNKLIPQAVIDREYRAQFVDESGGYFSAKEMNECTIKPGQMPCIELVGEKGYEYILAIDPNVSMDLAADHFAMCVLKIVQRPKDGRKMGLVVHQYACAGVELKHHISYLYYLLSKFNVVYVVCDTTQGQNMDFINVCNESEYFKSRKMSLNPIQAEFTNESFEETVKQVKLSYNNDPTVRRIVQKQFFSSPIIKAGNDHLRACFDQKLISFASHAASVPDMVARLCECDILRIHETHPEFHDPDLEGSGNMYEFVLYQDALIELVKKECALIEPSASPLGTITFDLPHHMTRNRKNINRNRKDSYSALWLANWGLKIYLAAQELPDREDDSFEPVLIPMGGA